MSILSSVELLKAELGTVKLSSDSKKIKFKQESYTNIISKYDTFCKKTMIPTVPQETNQIPIQDNIQPISMPESIVVHIENKNYEKLECKHDRLKERIFILKVEGRLLPQLSGKRALKIKENMKNNMLLNNAKAYNEALNIEKPEEQVEDEVRVTKNASSSAKIEKYSDVQENSTESTIKPMEAKPIIDIVNELKNINNKFKLDTTEEDKEKITVSPTIIEENVARPISMENNELEQNKEVNIKKETKNNMVVPEQFKEYLAKAEQLKAELSEAQKHVETAKADAQKAKEKAAAEKKEAEAVQEELMETIKKLERHNEALEKEKLAKEEEAKKYSEESKEYIAKEQEYSSMQQEYKNTINEMLAVIG